jgi:hypothetical protein
LRDLAIRVHTEFWSVVIPEGWDHEFVDGVLTMHAKSEIGRLELGSATKEDDEDVTDDDLYEFLAESGLDTAEEIDTTSYGDFSGLAMAGENDGQLVRQWFLRNGGTILMARYACPVENRGHEDGPIEETLESLRVENRGDFSERHEQD